MSITNLFENQSATANGTGTRGLAGTAQLTSTASQIATVIIQAIEANIDEYRDMLAASKQEHSAMDKLIKQAFDYDAVNTEFLLDLDDATINSMLKSQQSKRSRSKSKKMTLDNYKSYMTAAIAEHLIRTTCNKPKSAGGYVRNTVLEAYDEEGLQALAEDQDKLRKEIRNVQSKKSIMKSKADFDENSERYQLLLTIEQQLKSIRVGTSRTTVVEIDRTKEAMSNMLEDIDVDSLKAADSKDLIKQIKAMIGGTAE